MARVGCRSALCAVAFCHGLSGAVQARQREPVLDSVVVVANARHQAGNIHRFFLGEHYRTLWGTPVRAAVVNLDAVVTIEPATVNQQTVLYLTTADGRIARFTPLVTSPELALPPALARGFVPRAAVDQASAGYPASDLVSSRLLQAVGLWRAELPVLRVMPDDPRLGASRAGFGGQLGLLVFLTGAEAGTTGTEEASSDGLIRALWLDPAQRPDAREYLAQRLMDLYLGIWDRPGDRRWVLRSDPAGGLVWHQLPANRDHAFSRFDGLFLGMGGVNGLDPPKFGPRYDSPASMSWTERQLDRRLLVPLDRSDWDLVVESLEERLTDAVIDSALAGLPPEYQEADGGFLRAALVARRDDFAAVADEYYRFLSLAPDVEATDRDDVVTVDVAEDGATRVVMRRRDDEPAFFSRTFLPGETDEIRLYLRDGHDRALISGHGRGPLVRVVGGPGRDTLVDESTHQHARFYDATDGTVAVGTAVDQRNYRRPGLTDPAEFLDQDWGSDRTVIPRLQISSEVGLAIGLEYRRRRYGFRRQPYATRASGLVDFSFDRKSARLAGDVRRKVVDRDAYVSFSALASGLEGLRWFGEGNGTPASEPDDFYRVRQRVLEASTGIGLGLEGQYQLHILLRGRYTETGEGESINQEGLIGQVQPIGYGSYGQVGVQIRGEVNTRDNDLVATRGVLARVIVEADPWTDGPGSFGRVLIEGATYLTPGRQTRLTMALRAGGQAAFGDYPYFAAASLGGRRTLAGFHQGRFNGDQAASGSSELRFVVVRPGLLVPTDVGIVLRGDVGRVFSGQDLDQGWRSSVGSYLFLSAPSRSLVVLAGAAFAGEGARIYLGLNHSY